MTRPSWLVVAALALLVAPSFAATESAFPEGASEFSLGMGYANISLGSSSSIDSESAFRFEPSVMFSPIQQLPQLRLGGAVGVSMVLDNSTRTIIASNGNLLYRGSSEIPLWTLEPELRLSWRQTFGEYNQYFIEPGIAGGVAFAFLELENDDPTVDSYEENDSTFFGRVFLRVGAQVTGGLAGIEASYLTGGDVDLGGDATGDLSEFYIGIFGALLF
jgi:hypothetical protein